MFLKWEDSERFKTILSKLERWDIPMVAVGREHRIRGYLILKVDDVRELLSLVSADLLYDAYISPERVRSLEELGWDVEVLEASPNLLALWRVGLETVVTSKISEVREKFRGLLEALNEKKRI